MHFFTKTLVKIKVYQKVWGENKLVFVFLFHKKGGMCCPIKNNKQHNKAINICCLFYPQEKCVKQEKKEGKKSDWGSENVR